MSRFLRFLAEQHLEGHGNQLKESVIAVEVFGRKPDHDPLKDSIVRTEAGRLRGRLAEYYIGEGKADTIVIELPKGGYTPAFRLRESAPPPALPHKKIPWRVWPAVAAAVVIAIGAVFWLQQTDRFWRNPIAEGRFQVLTDFDGTEQAASVSRDGKFVTFLSNRDGNTDVWVTQPGSGQFHNLTQGSAPELVNPSVRVLGFSPDGSLVTFWVRKPAGEKGQIGIWAVPTLGGVSRPYREGVAEFDWSHDGSRLAYHTAASGDPLFISESANATHPKGPIFTAPAGLHSHFPLWGPDDRFIYVVYGALPDKLDIWRLQPSGGMPERITSHNGRVSHPVFLNRHTLIYLATDPDGSGPWIYSIDVNSRISHRLTSGPDRYTSLAAAADGKRLVITRASPKSTLWRIETSASTPVLSSPVRLALTPATTFSPRLGPDFLIFVSSTGTSQSIWKRSNGADTELWRGEGAQIIGSPAISPIPLA